MGYCENKQHDVHKGKKGLLCLFTDFTNPQTVEEEMTSTQATEWWSPLIELPRAKKAFPYKWVFKTETDQSGIVVCFKVRLLIKGYLKTWNTDNKEA